MMHLNFSYPAPESIPYLKADPFPHTVLKGAWDERCVRECKQAVDTFDHWDGSADTVVSRRKQTCGNIEVLPSVIKQLIGEASSPRFLRWLMGLTGEKSLVPDPYLEGGGIHRIYNEGFLKVHADFNWNRRIQLYRRLNLLLYLNPHWDDAWGGALELWAQSMKDCQKQVFPHANTMVIFTTDDKSYHGHPHPLACPVEVHRDSIALYYYSPVKPAQNFQGERTATNWRPIEGDRFHDVEATVVTRVGNKVRRLFGAGP